MNVFDFSARTLDGDKEEKFSVFRGKVLLIVNTASQCGFTPQYAGLQNLYETWKDRGLVVLGFPCNQFGAQEKGDSADIATFCEKNYGVTFPMFQKTDVNGPAAHPLFEHLKSQQRGFGGSRAIKWNFTKFLVSPQGAVLKRYGPQTRPENIDREFRKNPSLFR